MRALRISIGNPTRLALSLLAVLSLTSNIIGGAPVLARSKQVSMAQQGQQQQANYVGEGSGTLLAMLPGGKPLGSCPLKHTDVKASVAGYVARVSVKQTFQNNFDKKIEAVYTFPLPENAAVDEMKMTVGNRVIKGNIKKREEARQIYEQAKAQGHVTSLLDQERANIFTQSVANIEPGEKVEIEIKYVDTLPYESGSYSFNFPTVVGPRFIPGETAVGHTGRGTVPDTEVVPDASKITPKNMPPGQRPGHDISIAVDIDAGVPILGVKSDLHEVKSNRNGHKAHIELSDQNTIPNKDFVLHWDVAGDKLQSGCLTHNDGKSGFFTLMLMPPKKVTPDEISPKEMVFLIDCSGSQSGAPLEKAKETLDYIVDHMNPRDTFQIVAFSSGQTQFAERPQVASVDMRKKARTFISQLQANGGTWVAPAVEKVCAMPEDEHRLRIVTFMTDGFIGNDMEVLGLVKKYRGHSRWFSFGTGNSVNRFLIDGIAKEGGGEADYVLLNSPGPVVGKKFYDRISTPLLTDVKVNFEGLEVKEVFPHAVADVWAEKPLYIKGRYLKPGAGTISLTGFAGGKPYKQELKVNFPANNPDNEVIKPIWARAKVDRLMSEDWFGAQAGTPNAEIKDEIVKTALDYHIMTQYTSFVAVEETRGTKGASASTVDVPIAMPDGVTMAEESHRVLSRRASSVQYKQHSPSRYMAPSPIAASAGLPSPMAMSAPPPPVPQKNSPVSANLSGGGFAQGAVSSKAMEMQSTDHSPIVRDYRQAPTITHWAHPKSAVLGVLQNHAPSLAPSAPSGPSAPSNESFQQNKLKKDSLLKSVSSEKLDEDDAKTQSKLDNALIELLNHKKNGVALPKNICEVVAGKVTVKVNLKDLSSATVKKLRDLGLEVLVSNHKDNTLVARISIEKLEKLAELLEVLKIQPSHS